MLYFRAERKPCLQPEDIHKRIKPFPAALKFLKDTIQQTQKQGISSAEKDLEKENIKPGWLFSKAKDSARNQKVFLKIIQLHPSSTSCIPSKHLGLYSSLYFHCPSNTLILMRKYASLSAVIPFKQETKFSMEIFQCEQT